MVPATHFTHPLAVEAWDSWFRWRESGALRDVTIDATWWRVAQTLAAPEGEAAALWAHRYVDAFSRWRLLPDERLLQAAGTGHPLPDLNAPAAVLNVAAFISAPRSSRASFDRARFEDGGDGGPVDGIGVVTEVVVGELLQPFQLGVNGGGAGKVGIDSGLLGVHRGLSDVIDDATMNPLFDQEAKPYLIVPPLKIDGAILATVIDWPIKST